MCDAAIINFKMCVEKIEGIVKEKPMATKKKILYIVEAMGGGVFTYIVDLANELVDTYDMYIAYKTEKVEHPFTVYTLGRICYQKKPTLFNEIAGSFPNVKFVWIGDGELRGELTSKNIEITGWADRSTAIRYAVNADVFLLPSRWEGLPISLLESMYMKKICVVSNVIGNRDVIHPSRQSAHQNNFNHFRSTLQKSEVIHYSSTSIDALIKAQVNQSAHPP